uniref:Fas-binding factor 1 C-terminal domain-containing protein n=1 Tax=Timema poppense TaxID=170557 RepID=A0A7R9CQT6_TIMPO|nr:unnamed protein product [Timema poppensis]
MANFYGDLASDINSDDDSQISDLDPIQVAKMVESSDKSGEKLSKSRVSFDSPNKVAPVGVIDKGNKFNFGEFDTSDPLADLLSDDETPTPKKKSSKRNVVSPTNYDSGDGEISVSKHDISPFQASSERKEKSKVIADLFGLEDNAGINKHAALSSSHEGIVKVSGATDIKSSDWLGLKSPTKSPPSVPIVKKESEVLEWGFVDSNKTTSTFTQKGKVEQVSTKPKSILDELMEKTKVEMPKVKTLDTSSGTSKNTDTKYSSQVPNPISFGGYSPSVSTTREPRRSGQRRNSGVVVDPLGIFTSPTKNTQALTSKEQSLELLATPNIKSQQANSRRGSQPDWLGLSSSEDKIVSPAVVLTLQSSPKHTLKINPEQKMHDLAPLPSKPMQDQVPTHQHGNLPEWLGVEGSYIDSALSQNITLLSGAQFDQETAAAFLRQEQQLLMALHLKQREEQLASLHHRQQDMLCKQELQLQELVNQQLSRQKQVEDQLKKQQERINLHIQTLMSQPLFPPVSVLPPDPVLPPAPLLPNASLLSTDSVSPETQEENQSHIYLKNPQADLEARHQEEVLTLENLYKRHIALLESSLERLEHRLRGENSQLEKEYQAKIEKLQEEQRQLEEAHKHKLVSLQEERLSELKHLKELHQREVEELRERYTRAAEVEQDTTLQARKLLEIVADLEMKGGEQRAEVDSKKWELQQESARLEARTQALEKERHRALAHLEQERRDVQMLKQSLLEEQKQLNQDLREEQLKIGAERSRLQALARLQEGSSALSIDAEQLKVEAEAAIQVAQDASRRSDAEREKLLEHQCQLQHERRKLQELERDITTKQQELDTLTQMAAATKNEGLQALDEARNLEKQHNIREKVTLSQERVSLRRSKEQKYCAFCRTLLEQQVPTSDKCASTSTSYSLKHFIDPEQVIMKLTSEREHEDDENFLSSLISK